MRHDVRFSGRLPQSITANAITVAIARARAEGLPILDLTESNPTTVGFPYPLDLLSALASPEARRYEPCATGRHDTRAAIAADYRRRGAVLDPDHVVLSASTSEAYSWLFKLLCDPGDAVLIPRPSYPLFEHITGLEAVVAAPYTLRHHGRWEIDFSEIERAPGRTKAIVVVSPNNPTGSYLSARELEVLVRLCRERGWALIADEVFAEYPLGPSCQVTEIATRVDVLAFTLGGASKQFGLPQIKLAWTLVGGRPHVRDEALRRLEVIADSFLSVSTPVQLATPSFVVRTAGVRHAIRERVRRNFTALSALCAAHPACSLLEAEGGWSAVIRVPATRSEEALVLELIEREHVLVHPGYFFDFLHEAFVVVSLLTREETFLDGCRRVLRHASGSMVTA